LTVPLTSTYTRFPTKEEGVMRCAICKHGDTQPGVTTVSLERDGKVLVIPFAV